MGSSYDRSSKGEDIHFKNGQIWDSVGMRFRKGELILSDGIIEEITFGATSKAQHGKGTEVFDIKGGYVSPGFIDGHMHLFQWSISRSGLDLSHCRSLKEIVALIESVVDGRLENRMFQMTGIVMGVDFDDSPFQSGIVDNNRHLEDRFPDIPVIARRICGHKAIANTLGLEVLGISEDGHINGLLIEDHAMDIPWHLPIQESVSIDLYRKAAEELYGNGVVGGVDIIPLSQYGRLMDIQDTSEIIFRSAISMIRDVSMGPPYENGPENDSPFISEIGKPEYRLGLSFEKFFLDGSIGARTASFDRDYLDAPKFPLLHSDEELKEMVMRSYGEGLVPMVHCIGEAAISQAIRVLEGIGGPYRLEHAEAMTDEHLAAMNNGKGGLCLQPNFQHIWGRKGGLYEKALGSSEGLNRLRSIVGSKVPWCFGTDMMPPSPLYAFKGGMEHPYPSQRLLLSEMVEGFTVGAARLSFLEDEYGFNFKVGSSPDIAVLNKDLASVSATLIGGRMVFNEGT
ncbi:MAG: amidohydrolase [Thermoplasmatota archaeon]